MLDSLPDAARVWLFPLDRTLDSDAADALRRSVADWLPSWTSHGRPVQAEAEVLAGRAFAVGAVISEADLNAGVSGCGIDSMERAVSAALDAHGLALASPLAVTFRDADGAWQTAPRPAFRRLTKSGEAGPQTPVLDVTATTVGGLRAHGVERPAGETWAARAFALA
ncbi:hypothetical protein [Rubrivirga marina]|uniref:Uncharacterized protein n=1 Tax=Rubrivirga marina TaxID=1196024 RepID=A0A271J4Y3_9BACT|nr:hypothetical protein [Rubrivirga marina]PAP78493.1 hypothetical protein BSZ37_19715 [Rubrivirga marina]